MLWDSGFPYNWKSTRVTEVRLEDISNKVPIVNPLTPKSDKHLISPHKITSDSHLQVTRIKEMIIK